MEIQIKELEQQVKNLKSQNEDLIRNVENWKKWNKEVAERNRGQLFAVFYMLDHIKHNGTHREKETVIQAIRGTIESLIKNGDQMPIHLENPDLPF